MPTAPRDRGGFRIALLCALSLEADKVQSMFDICWEDQDIQYGKAVGDQNAYNTGVIGNHNVVLVYMPSMGGNSAALAAAGLRSSFPGVQLALVVGICAVVPIHPETKLEIVLGDVVISTAVIQYDFGRQYPNGFERKKEVEDSLGRASPEIRSFLNMLRTRHNQQRFNKKVKELVQSAEFRGRIPGAIYPGAHRDQLYEAAYLHTHRMNVSCDTCIPNLGVCSKDCAELGCEDEKLLTRERHALGGARPGQCETYVPYVHLGRFGSANTVMKSGLDRDRISTMDKIAAVEMEGAGVWEQYPTIVIKAACDYGDSHKNKDWQDYAAAMAAACLKVFLREWVNPQQPFNEDVLSEHVCHIPFDPMPGFVGREGVLVELGERLFDSKSRRVVALLGLGGIGKSRLALEFAHQIKSKYPQHSRFWVQASNQLTLENDMLEIGRKLQIPGIGDTKADIKMLVQQRLSLLTTGEWLLILDNADDETLWAKRSIPDQQELSLVDYLPKTTNGSILITTRTRAVATFLAEKEVISLHPLMQETAAQLFTSRLEDHSLAAHQASLLSLVNKLACLPLAIVQAASFVNMTGISVQSYLDLLDQPEAEVVKLLSEDFGDALRYPDAMNPIASTWLISFEHIRTRHSLAAEFLAVAACLNEKGIPSSLLPVVESKTDNIKALAVLKGYSFVTKQSSPKGTTNEDEIYDVHRLVQLAARHWLKKEGAFAVWTKICVLRLVQLFPNSDHENKSLWTLYLPHAQRICENSTGDDLGAKYDLLLKMGLVLLADGEYARAVKYLTNVANWREGSLSKSHAKTLEAYTQLGEALLLQGDYSQAEYYIQPAVRGQTAASGKAERITLMSMSILADIRRKQRRYVEAEKIFREVLTIQETVLGLDRSHRDLLFTMSSLGNTFSGQERYVEAEKILREVIQIRETILGKGHPETLVTMHDLSVVLYKQGHREEAVELMRSCAMLRMEVLGPEHPYTRITLSDLEILAWQEPVD